MSQRLPRTDLALTSVAAITTTIMLLWAYNFVTIGIINKKPSRRWEDRRYLHPVAEEYEFSEVTFLHTLC